jgi:hypothetical protein
MRFLTASALSCFIASAIAADCFVKTNFTIENASLMERILTKIYHKIGLNRRLRYKDILPKKNWKSAASGAFFQRIGQSVSQNMRCMDRYTEDVISHN